MSLVNLLNRMDEENFADRWRIKIVVLMKKK